MCRLDARWVREFNAFVEFIRIHSRVPKASETFRGISVGSWYLTQKSMYKKDILSKDRLASLEGLYCFWYDSSKFNSFLSNSNNTIIKVNFGEIPISALAGGDDLARYLSLGITSVEDLYRVGYSNNRVEYCVLAFNKLFPHMEFYQARLLKDVYKDKEFLNLINLKRYLDIDTQKELSLEINKVLKGMLPQRSQALQEVYMLGKSYIEGANSMNVGVYRFSKLVSWGIKSLRCSNKLKELISFKETGTIEKSSIGYFEILDRLSSIKGDISQYSGKDFMLKIKPILREVNLDSMGMSYRSTSSLKGSGIQSLDELLYYSNEELLGIPNVGKASLEEIESKLEPLRALLFCNREIFNVYKEKIS